MLEADLHESLSTVVENQLQVRSWRAEECSDAIATVLAIGADDILAEIALDEWAVGTACYMCHACTNFGVHGKEVRPCARGLNEIITRRQQARSLRRSADK